MDAIAQVITKTAHDWGATGNAQTVTGAIDLLIDALDGEDSETKQTVAGAFEQLANHIKPLSIPAYVVAFDANGGSGTAATVACAKWSTCELDDGEGLTNEGYTFEGWADSASATAADYDGGATYSATEDVTLYAVWAAVPADDDNNGDDTGVL